jgi:hypothetical protein
MTGVEWFESVKRSVVLTLTTPRSGNPILRGGGERLPVSHLEDLVAVGYYDVDAEVTTYTVTAAGLRHLGELTAATQEDLLAGELAELDKRRADKQAELDRLRDQKGLRDG